MNIRTQLKNATTVLFTDSEYFNKDITGVKCLSDIKDCFTIRGKLKKVECHGNKVTYKLNNQYDFTLTII